MAESSKGPWIIAAAIVLAAALVVGAWASFRSQDQSCAEWQATFRTEAQTFVADASESIAEVEERKAELAARLLETKPDGCPIPNA